MLPFGSVFICSLHHWPKHLSRFYFERLQYTMGMMKGEQIAWMQQVDGLIDQGMESHQAIPADWMRAVIARDDTPLPSMHRLLVLTPSTEVDEAELARRVWSLASPQRLAVLYLGLVRDLEDEPRVRRQVATLAALTRDDSIVVETHSQLARDWLQLVDKFYRPGDVIVCPVELEDGGWVARLRAPVYVLFDIPRVPPPRRLRQVARLVNWLVPIAIIAGFFWLQVQVDRLTTGGIRLVLFSLSVLAEFGLIGMWNYILNG